MKYIDQQVKVRTSVFDSNLRRSRNLAIYSRESNTDNFPNFLDDDLQYLQLINDLGMYSVVAAISSLDEFIKTISADALFGYITNQWIPRNQPVIRKINSNSLFKITHLSIELIKMTSAGEEILDPLNATFINEIIHQSTKDINFQSYNDFNTILKELTGVTLTKSLESDGYTPNQINSLKTKVTALARKRHEYVHRLATFKTTPGGDHSGLLYKEPISDEEIEILKIIASKISAELIAA